LEGVKGDAVIDGELVALDEYGVSHFQLLQNALRRKAKLLYSCFRIARNASEDVAVLPRVEGPPRSRAVRY
jgi:bifunctional non-homologous end joining protein LigD